MSDFIFTPQSENDLLDFLASGECNFEVVEATSKTSSSGNQMIKLKLKVWDMNGDEGFIYDNLILTSSKFLLRKIKDFCYSCGLENFYDAGKLSALDCNGKSGKAVLGIEKGVNGYNDRNVIKGYIRKENQAKTDLDFRN
jgi:hypothetical protein